MLACVAEAYRVGRIEGKAIIAESIIAGLGCRQIERIHGGETPSNFKPIEALPIRV